MPTREDIRWFKNQFQSAMEKVVARTPLTVDFVTALACQETGSIWSFLRKADLSVSQITALCVGDTLDQDKGRKAFPRTKSELLAKNRGKEMFELGHQALVDMAKFVPGYNGVAKNPDKFCHGYGVFQLDLQFFLEDPDFFLKRSWQTFDGSLGRAMIELKDALVTLGFQNRQSPLSDVELAYVEIVYNTGTFKPGKDLKQGYYSDGRFYGQNLFDFIRLCHTVAADNAQPSLAVPAPNQAIVPIPTPLSGFGEPMRVETKEGMLRVRSEPIMSQPAQANVTANLPDGHSVRALTTTARNGFLEIETSLAGALIRGFSSKKFLVPDGAAAPVAVEAPDAVPAVTLAQAASPGTGGQAASIFPPVFMPRKDGVVTRRSKPADAHTINEKGQPIRTGETPQELRASIAAIIEWLAVDDERHVRYQPRDGLTFCNIYAHDFCFLAGCYLPRCWWSTPALLKLKAGESVEPLFGNTINEMRANDLFRWLRDFGLSFGWRQTSTPTKLQTEVNQGAIGLVVARRKEDGRSGHIVMVVPESDEHAARRDNQGEVIAPLQSQAGSKNFRHGTSAANWWNGEQFAEFAFWIHA